MRTPPAPEGKHFRCEQVHPGDRVVNMETEAGLRITFSLRARGLLSKLVTSGRQEWGGAGAENETQPWVNSCFEI